MAKLTAKARKALPKSDYAIPSKKPKSGSYPIPDKNHARLAKAMVSKYGTPAQKAQVNAKVAAKYPTIGKKKK